MSLLKKATPIRERLCNILWKYLYRAVDKQGNTVDWLWCKSGEGRKHSLYLVELTLPESLAKALLLALPPTSCLGGDGS